MGGDSNKEYETIKHNTASKIPSTKLITWFGKKTTFQNEYKFYLIFIIKLKTR
jgi:hypothetical protein